MHSNKTHPHIPIHIRFHTASSQEAASYQRRTQEARMVG